MTRAALALGTLGLLAGLYLAATAFLYARQRAFLYPAPRVALPDRDVPEGFARARLRAADGLDLDALHRPARGGLPTIVFFHGNGDGLAGALVATERLAAAGYGLLLPEYRGYAGNPGTPSEAGLYRDGAAALAWLRDRGLAPGQIVLMGNSLGSGVATELAARTPVAALVLVSPFTSMPDAAAGQLRMFPVRALMKDRYDNRAKLPRVAAPVLLLHGTTDTLIPADHSRRLAAAAPRAELVVVRGAGHELAYLPAAQARIAAWLRTIPAGERP